MFSRSTSPGSQCALQTRQAVVFSFDKRYKHKGKFKIQIQTRIQNQIQIMQALGMHRVWFLIWITATASRMRFYSVQRWCAVHCAGVRFESYSHPTGEKRKETKCFIKKFQKCVKANQQTLKIYFVHKWLND